ncbi:MAG: hypothetical protein JJU00_05885 [Opitutales bacterium]|nr:hypothetical protein [Opitutales bacterium]
MLTLLSLILAAILIALGAAFFRCTAAWRSASMRFLRSEQAAYVTLGAGGLWFLYNVWNLSPADNLFNMDFGLFRMILLGLFGGTMVGAFFVVKDFLSVRGLAILILLFGATGLGAAFGHYDIPQRLFFVTLLYILITFATVIGAAPFYLRNLLEWLYAATGRARVLGGTLAVLGGVLAVVSFTY